MTGAALFTGLLIGTAVVVWRADVAGDRVARLAGVRHPATGPAGSRQGARLGGVQGWAERPWSWLLVLVAGVGGTLVAGPVAGALVATATAVAVRAARRRRAAAASQARRTAVVDVSLALASELSAGQPPAVALAAAAEVAGPLRPGLTEAAGAAVVGSDPRPALMTAAALPGADGLRAVAAAWQVAADAGAALSHALTAVAAALEEHEQTRAEVMAALAGPRATGRALMGLPLVGVAMAASIGAHPGRLLLHTGWGALLCGTAAVLAAGGHWWLERLALRAAPP